MYTIELTSEAEDDLKWFDRRERNIIVDGITTNLSYEPTVMTMNRKPCRDDGTKIAD
jgi:mRNA-degrading endonuclease RelE of RelBE toxin-antitoxin system